ncbi:MAG TPA: hypothetical protein VK923_06280 [Euzebyales bacterium]|nr:hypothetical protein [Euzebyales bacterium]
MVSAHLAAGDDRVVAQLRAAAKRAMRQGAPTSSATYLRRAVREPPAVEVRPVVLAELGHAEVTAGLPDAVAHLQAAVALTGDAHERARLLLKLGRALHHNGQLDDACAAFSRGLRELSPVEPGDELAIEMQGGYLNAAMFTPDRAGDAHRRAPQILDGADALSTTPELALLSKAVMMRTWAAGPRQEIVAAARRLLHHGLLLDDADADEQVPWQVIAALEWCDDVASVKQAVRLALADARRGGSVLAFVLASVLRARQALWTGSIAEAVHDARSALEVLPAGSVYESSAAYCLV